jgi:surface antigen
MNNKRKWLIIVCGIFAVIIFIAATFAFMNGSIFRSSAQIDNNIGEVIDSYKGVNVYDNGADGTSSYGKNYSDDGYYFGYKWQCVEFVKRFFYQAKKHKMPNVMGNAKDFFSFDTKQGEMNKDRGLIQYYNGGNVSPEADDLLVFTDGGYGHAAIITSVSANEIEVIQQNVFGKTRDKYKLTVSDGNYFIENNEKPAGWLRAK